MALIVNIIWTSVRFDLNVGKNGGVYLSRYLCVTQMSIWLLQVIIILNLGLFQQSNISMTLKSYTCHHCSGKFALKKSLSNHIHSTHMPKPIKLEQMEIEHKYPNFTNGSFYIRADIEQQPQQAQHQQEAPPNAIQERKFRCQSCNKFFNHRSNLRRHMALSHDKMKKFKCRLCSQMYRYKWNLKYHMQQHKGPKIYSCSECKKAFALKSNLVKHIKHHLDDINQCKICCEIFQDKETLEEHEKSHQNRRFKCPGTTCDRIFTSLTRMRNHIDQKHEEENLYKCKKCKKVFSDETRFFLHGISHTKFFRCSECEKRFSNEDILRQHFRNYHQKEEAYVCNYCYDSFGTKTTLIDHFHDHQIPYMCNHCFFMFPDEESLRNHDCTCCFTCPFCHKKYKIEKHLEKHIESCIQTNSSNTVLKTLQKCRYCQRMFRNEDKLTAHEMNHTMEKTLYKCTYCHKVFKKCTSFEKHMEKHNRYASAAYKCNICKKAYPTEKNLERHMLHHNIRLSFRCKSCGNRFESEEALIVHQVVHERKVHKCTYVHCEESFSNKKHLKQHLLAHEKVRLYRCPKCPKLFRHESHLQNHFTVHSESEVHKCLYCYKIFVHKAHLDKHLIMHETNEMHNCDFCFLTFATQSDMIRHMRSHDEYHVRNICEICGDKFTTHLRVKEHMRIFHNMFTCMHCGETLSSSKHYESHLLVIHNIESAQQADRNLNNMHKCDHCMKIFTTEIHLKNHKKYIHAKAYSCQLCSKTFAFQSLLTTHIDYQHSQNNIESESNQSFSNQSSFVYNDETSSYSQVKQDEDSCDTYIENANDNKQEITTKEDVLEPLDEDLNDSNNIESNTYNVKVKEEPVSASNGIIPIDYMKEGVVDISDDIVSTSNAMIPISYIKEESMEFDKETNESAKEEPSDEYSGGEISNYYDEETTAQYIEDDEELQEEDITNHLHEIQSEDTQTHLMEIKQYHLQLDNNDTLVSTFENNIKIEENDVFIKTEVPQENQENILNHISTEQSESHACNQCNITYYKLKDLLAHINKAHNSIDSPIVELKSPVET